MERGKELISALSDGSPWDRLDDLVSQTRQFATDLREFTHVRVDNLVGSEPQKVKAASDKPAPPMCLRDKFVTVLEDALEELREVRTTIGRI